MLLTFIGLLTFIVCVCIYGIKHLISYLVHVLHHSLYVIVLSWMIEVWKKTHLVNDDQRNVVNL